jgi:hypothetical protein
LRLPHVGGVFEVFGGEAFNLGVPHRTELRGGCSRPRSASRYLVRQPAASLRTFVISASYWA